MREAIRAFKVFSSFSDVFQWFQAWNHWKRFEMHKKGWKRLKKVVRPAFGWEQHPKAGRNTQELGRSWTKNLAPVVSNCSKYQLLLRVQLPFYNFMTMLFFMKKNSYPLSSELTWEFICMKMEHFPLDSKYGICVDFWWIQGALECIFPLGKSNLCLHPSKKVYVDPHAQRIV